MPDPRPENLSERVKRILSNDLIEIEQRVLVRCEVPGCRRKATEAKPQRSGDIVYVCGQPHVYHGECEQPDGCTPTNGGTAASHGDAGDAV